MEDEVFGPILPILTYRTLDGAIRAEFADGPRPLAAFIFSRDQSTIDRFVGELSFGGGAVNQVNIHLFVETMPFGGWTGGDRPLLWEVRLRHADPCQVDAHFSARCGDRTPFPAVYSERRMPSLKFGSSIKLMPLARLKSVAGVTIPGYGTVQGRCRPVGV